MDSPVPADDASSLPHSPDLTSNNSADLVSTAPVPSSKKPTRPRRRAVRQRAKTPFQDTGDNSDDGQDQGKDGKPPTRRPRREVTTSQTMFSEMSNINSKPASPAIKPETQSGLVLFPEMSDFQSKASTPASEPAKNPRVVLFSDAADIDSRASAAPIENDNDEPPPPHAAKSGYFTRQSQADQKGIEEHADQPEGTRRKALLEHSSTVTSPELHQRKKLSSTMRGASVFDRDMADKDVNTVTPRESATDTRVKLERETYEPGHDVQSLNPFSPSAVPPSKGNSPTAIKARRKPATKKKPTKDPVKQARKQVAEEAVQRQKQPTKDQAKPRSVAPVQRTVESSSNGEIKKEGATSGSDLEKDEKSIRPSMPRQANFKPLKSPINSSLAPTQDVIQISSCESDSSGEDGNLRDDNFVPTNTLSPRPVELAHPKTRAAAQSGAAKAARKNRNAQNARDVKPQRRVVEKNPATDESAAAVKPKSFPKQSANSPAAEKTHVGETDHRSKTQIEKELAPVTSALSQTNKTSTARKSANSHVLGSNGQPKKMAVVSKPAQARTRRAETGQAGNTAIGLPRHPNIIEFGTDGPKGNGKLPRITKANVLQAPEGEVTTAEKPKSKAIVQDLRKQSPGKISPKRPLASVPDSNNPWDNVQGHPAKRRAPGDVHSLVPVVDADEEYGKSVFEDQVDASATLVYLTPNDHETAGTGEGVSHYTNDGNAKSFQQHSDEDAGNTVLASDKNWSSAVEHDIPVVPQANRSPQKSHTVPSLPDAQYAMSSNPLKRRFPGNNYTIHTADAKNPGTSLQSHIGSVFSASLISRLNNTIVTPMDVEPVAKKQKFEVINTASNSQDHNTASRSVVPCILSSDGSDDVFGPQKQGGPAKRTAFVRRCISNQPGDNGPAKVQASLSTEDQPIDHITAPSHHQQQTRARALQDPDHVARRMLAAISAPAAANGAVAQCSSDGLGIEQVDDRKCAVPEQPQVSRVPDVDEREEAWRKATEPYGEGLGEMMHKTVNVILRSLKTKEDSISDVVDDYGREGKRIVDRMSAKHEKERAQLLHQYEQYRLNYINVCTEARRRTRETWNDLRSVDLDQVVAGVGTDPVIDRLKKLQRALQKPA